MPNRQISHADRADGGSAVVRSLSVQIQLLRSSCHWEDLFHYTQKKYVSFGPHKTRVSTELTLWLLLELLVGNVSQPSWQGRGPVLWTLPPLHARVRSHGVFVFFPFKLNAVNSISPTHVKAAMTSLHQLLTHDKLWHFIMLTYPFTLLILLISEIRERQDGTLTFLLAALTKVVSFIQSERAQVNWGWGHSIIFLYKVGVNAEQVRIAYSGLKLLLVIAKERNVTSFMEQISS